MFLKIKLSSGWMSTAVMGCAVHHFIDDGKNRKLITAILCSAFATLCLNERPTCSTEG